jgi:Photosynthetic reaction centre cytochrome C subunit
MRSIRPMVAVVFLLSLLGALCAAEPPKPAGPTAGEKFKNVKVLRDLPASEWGGTMTYFAASLGVGCNYCHAPGKEPGKLDFPSDAKKEKLTARKMILMARSIDEANFKGRMEVSCATCHHGSPEPGRVPPLDQVALRVAHQKEEATSSERYPEPAQVFARYLEALGGETAIGRVHEVSLKETVRHADGASASAEILRQAPGRVRVTMRRPDGKSFVEAFDGKVGWAETPEGARSLEGGAVEHLREEAVLFPGLEVKDRLDKFRVIGREKIDGRDAWVLDARRPEGGRDRLFFDVESGLLLRQYWEKKTAFGPLPSAMLYSDYREVDGVKIPFTVHGTSQWSDLTETVAEASVNAPIDASAFEPPASLKTKP